MARLLLEALSTGLARRRILLIVVWVVVFALPANAATASKKKPKAPSKPSIAVLAFEGLAPAADKLDVETELRALLPLDDYVIQPADKTEATLEAVKKLGLACDSGDVDCLIRVGALSGATVVLKGVLSVDGEVFSLDLIGVDVTGLRERGRVRVTVPRTERRAALGSAVVGVLRPEAWRGQLKVSVSQRGASVIVDGVPRGISQLATPIELTPGPHAVFVSLEGFAAWKETVEVRYAEESAVDVVLAPGVTEAAPTFSTKKPTEPPDPLPMPPPPPRKGPLRVIVYDVEAVGVEERIASAMGSFLVAELRKREHVSVLDSGELRALVGDGTTTTGDTRGCSEDQCFAEVAEALGADAIVVTSLTQTEGQILFGLRRIDQQKQEVTGFVIERVPAADTAALLPLVGQSIQATFADVPLRAGQRSGVDDSAALRLNPPPVAPWITNSLGLGATVAGTVGVLGGAGALWVWFDYGALLAAGETNNNLAPRRDAWTGLQVAAFVGAGTGLALGIATAAVAPFTDWQGYGDVAAGGAP